MTATHEVLDAVAKSGLSIRAQACMAAISEGDGGDTMRRLYSGPLGLRDPSDPNVSTDAHGRIWTGPLDVFPPWKGVELPGQADYTTAAGILQFTGSSWRRVVAVTGKPHFENDHITNGWWLAQHDFHAHSGMDLAQAIENDALLPAVHTFLVRTWPGGADSGFPKRFAANLAALQAHPPVGTPIIYIQLAAETADGMPAKVILGSPPAKPSALGSVAKAAIAAVIIAGGAVVCNSADGVAETKPTFWAANKPTFVLVPGPLGPLAVPTYE